MNKQSIKMRRKNNFKKKILLLFIFLTSSIYISAQKHSVNPLDDLVAAYSEKYDAFTKEIEAKELEEDKKIFVCAGKISELKEEFKAKRIIEYKTKEVKRAKRLSCKGTRIRGVTECDVVVIKAPNENMFTKKEWITQEGSDKVVTEVVNNSSVSLKMTATGTRLNEAVVYTVYKYKQDAISEIVNKEATDLFNKIINK